MTSASFFSNPSLYRRFNRLIIVILWIALLPASGSTKELGLMAIGARWGVNDSTNEESFYQIDAFATYGLPWHRPLGNNWTLGIYLEGTLGMLSGGGDSGGVASLGPGIYLSSGADVFNLWLGVNPTLISREKYGAEDLGGPFHFTSHAGITIGFVADWWFGLRVQHMSSAGISEPNPGINLYMLEAGYRF